jgi:hypothetical protein
MVEANFKDQQVPSVTYKAKYFTLTPQTTVNDQTPVQTISITYEINSNSRLNTTSALITIDNIPVVTTFYQISDHRHNTTLTCHALSCLVPILWCSTELPRQTTDYVISVQCNSKQIQNQLQRVKNTLNSPSQCYCPEWDLLSTTIRLLKRFKSHKLTLSPHKSNEHEQTSPRWICNYDQVDTQHQWITKTSSFDVVQLRIHHHRVSSEYTSAIRKAHTAPEIDDYYVTKYGWRCKTVKNIRAKPKHSLIMTGSQSTHHTP